MRDIDESYGIQGPPFDDDDESVDDDAILAYELDRCDRQDVFDNAMEERRCDR